MRVAVEAHGCRLNRADAETMQAALERAGHRLVRRVQDADVYVLNGCTITAEADADARAAVRRAKRANPAARVVVSGCYGQGASVGAQLEEADAYLGTADQTKIVDLLSRLEQPLTQPLLRVSELTRRIPFSSLPAAPAVDRSRAHLKVQDGCNYRCAFCIVPSVRGRSRSLSPDEVVARLRDLVEGGAPEVVLTGVHLGTYGRDLPGEERFASLLGRLVEACGSARLRFGSFDPHEVDDEMIAVLARAGRRVCRHLHLPVQSGDPSVLRRMRRGHGVDELRDLASKLEAALPGIALGSDVIVGFPGETDEAFERSYALVEELPIRYVHVFSYSVREGTEAASMPDQVEAATKRARSAALRALSERKWLAFRQRLLDRELDVVVHKTRHPRHGSLVGLSSENVRVELDGPDTVLGRRIGVRLQRLDGPRSFGRSL